MLCPMVKETHMPSNCAKEHENQPPFLLGEDWGEGDFQKRAIQQPRPPTYLAQIEEYFFKYRRQGGALSPKNWLIAERWEQMGIPVHIVCKGIKKTCRGFRSAHKEGEERIDILTYCEPEIFRLWKEHKRALLGAPRAEGGDVEPDASKGDQVKGILLKRLKGIMDDLITLTTEDKESAINSRALFIIDWLPALDLIEGECRKDEKIDIDSVEKRLLVLDKAYIDTIFGLLSEEQKEELTHDAEEELLPYKEQMDSESYQETLDLSIQSVMRARFNVRRISLYAT
jgi:hypothetical protein